MKIRIVHIQSFAGGTAPMPLPEDGEMVKFRRDVNHGDWKTASVFPERWPTIKKGTPCKVVGWMQNLYGVHIKVEHQGSTYDIEAHEIEKEY